MSDQEWDNYVQYLDNDPADIFGNPIDEETLTDLQQD